LILFFFGCGLLSRDFIGDILPAGDFRGLSALSDEFVIVNTKTMVTNKIVRSEYFFVGDNIFTFPPPLLLMQQ
jgi:hypothetical protein